MKIYCFFWVFEILCEDNRHGQEVKRPGKYGFHQLWCSHFLGFKHVFSVFLWTFRRFIYWEWFNALFWFWCGWDISEMLLCTIGIILVVDWIYIRMKLWNYSHVGYSGIIKNLWVVTIIKEKGHFHQTFCCKIAPFN